MTIGGSYEDGKFRPKGFGGGSKKGKPQGAPWPLVVAVGACALVVRFYGTVEKYNQERRFPFSLSEFRELLNGYYPGVWEYLAQQRPGRTTDLAEFLSNRVYKWLVYSGTSDRGVNHDPWTRASMPRESIYHRVPVGSVLWKVFHYIQSGKPGPIPGWKKLL